MPFRQWLSRRSCIFDPTPPPLENEKKREESIPSLTITINQCDAIPFPSVTSQPHPGPRPSSLPRRLSRQFRRVASCLSPSSRLSSSSSRLTSSPVLSKRNTIRSRLSISTNFPRPSTATKGNDKKTLKKFISYPVLRSSSSPISPHSSSEEGSWGMRRSTEKVPEKEPSIYGLEEILRLSLCPPHLFSEEPTSSSDFQSTLSDRHSVDSDESVSLSLFDDEKLLFANDTATTTTTRSTSCSFYPHQPIVNLSSSRPQTATSSTTNRSKTPFGQGCSKFSSFEDDDGFDGFSFAPTRPPSPMSSIPGTPTGPTINDDFDEAFLQARQDVSKTSFDAPPSLHKSTSFQQDPPRSLHPFARNSGKWLGSTSQSSTLNPSIRPCLRVNTLQ